MRNVVAHQAFVWLALMPSEDDFHEIHDYDFPSDGNEEERGARKVVRRLLGNFVSERRKEIQGLLQMSGAFIKASEAADRG